MAIGIKRRRRRIRKNGQLSPTKEELEAQAFLEDLEKNAKNPVQWISKRRRCAGIRKSGEFIRAEMALRRYGWTYHDDNDSWEIKSIGFSAVLEERKTSGSETWRDGRVYTHGALPGVVTEELTMSLQGGYVSYPVGMDYVPIDCVVHRVHHAPYVVVPKIMNVFGLPLDPFFQDHLKQDLKHMRSGSGTGFYRVIELEGIARMSVVINDYERRVSAWDNQKGLRVEFRQRKYDVYEMQVIQEIPGKRKPDDCRLWMMRNPGIDKILFMMLCFEMNTAPLWDKEAFLAEYTADHQQRNLGYVQGGELVVKAGD